MAEQIAITRAQYKRFKRAYAKAVREKVDTFTFEGREYVVKYAYYMLQYLATFYEKKK
jgi:hypothetical protein